MNASNCAIPYKYLTNLLAKYLQAISVTYNRLEACTPGLFDTKYEKMMNIFRNL
jgi:hypothetical protein